MREASLYHDVETGGILIGRIESAKEIHVTHATGPGLNAVHHPAHFLRDTAYCAGVLREHYERHGVDYVGEWHSHVGLLRVPSDGELLTLSEMSAEAGGFRLPEDASRVRKRVNSLLSAAADRERN